MYTIKVRYITGDSFNSYETDCDLEGSWELEVAKENLKRIKEHYKLYDNRNNYYSLGMAEYFEQILKDINNASWFCKGNGRDSSTWQWHINLKENDGSEKDYYVRWCGYFERLVTAKVTAITPEENDMEFSV